MKKVFESSLNGFDEVAERLIVWEMESPHEFIELNDMVHEELLREFGYVEDVCTTTGGTCRSYQFEPSTGFLLIIETNTLNV